ncbi:diacylglycerol/lipid kinase family protein [Devosia sp. A16]|uniref:diacylglycerol/lipid kinase family protein n=1 Tax=Devosia sp. A16 TaxID=1736675 RepID=UPI000B0098FE|nr:diacylglycerol kinase family protein [Devosia sp. A16]
MPQTKFHIVLNPNSGAALRDGITAERLHRLFAERGISISVDADAERPFEERIQTARQSGAEMLLSAGGDGTVTALAEVAMETGRTLAVLPLGTANLLARDLSIPIAIEAWFDALEQMTPRRIDVGEVNGRIFLHKVVIGAVPGIAAAREKLRGRAELAARIGFLGHFIRRLSRLRRFAVEITPRSGEPRIERVQSIAIANNDYAEGLGQVFHRPHLDEGTLSLYLLRQLRFTDALRLAIEMVLGNWRNDDVLEVEHVRALTVRTRRRLVRAMLDGEIVSLSSPLRFRILPLALSILAPPAPAETAAPLEAS